jgi:sphingosine kinase
VVKPHEPNDFLDICQSGFDVVAATLNAIKGSRGFVFCIRSAHGTTGSPMPVDVFSVTFSGRRVLSLLSQTVGFLADCDIGTEHLRWMGDSRFIWGAVRERQSGRFASHAPHSLLLHTVFTYKQCPVELSIKVEQSDKHEIWEAYHEAREEVSTPESPWDEETEDNKFLGLPPIKQITAVPERSWEWTTLDCPLLTVSGGQGPYVNR